MKDSFPSVRYIAALPLPRTMATSLRPIELFVTVSRLSLGCNRRGKSSFLVHAGKFGEWPTSPDIHFSNPLPNKYLISSSALGPHTHRGDPVHVRRGSLIFSTVCQNFYRSKILFSVSLSYFFCFPLFQRCRLSNLGRWQVRSLLLELLHCSLLNVFILHIYKYIKEEEIPFTTAEFGIYVNTFIHRHDFRCLVVS